MKYKGIIGFIVFIGFVFALTANCCQCEEVEHCGMDGVSITSPCCDCSHFTDLGMLIPTAATMSNPLQISNEAILPLTFTYTAPLLFVSVGSGRDSPPPKQCFLAENHSLRSPPL